MNYGGVTATRNKSYISVFLRHLMVSHHIVLHDHLCRWLSIYALCIFNPYGKYRVYKPSPQHRSNIHQSGWR